MKAVITDLDRTLLRTDKTISVYTCDVMKRCHEHKLYVIAATARPERAIEEYKRQISFDGIVTLNGARCILKDQVVTNGIEDNQAMQMLLKLVQIPGAVVSIETGEGIFSNVPIPEWNSTVVDFTKGLPTKTTVYKILASSAKENLHNYMGELLTEDVYYTVAVNELFQIMSKKATKLSGIQMLLKELEIAREDVIYFGDDQDDVNPIEWCGTGVAMANAIAEVVQVADEVTLSNDEDGVAKYLEKKGLMDN